ncbi:YtxH domain-containing protein [Flavobacterium limi]|uniref:YtxH domain-containing protein n=1 Tax=Flavobacterium limi TaxID=2045105 RepID=A0ABQ1TKS1_9FLAO|nr:YtxH domain-containing protein [Flavobacterium limi]GGE97716.1 hypothetical protein GCM10011518_03910 [Flavobacterium limi]
MGLSSFLKNFLGKIQEPAAETENTNQHTAENAYEKAEIFIEETLTKVKEASEPLFEDASQYVDKAKVIISEYAEKASDSINDIIDSVKESVEADDTQPMIYDTVVDISEKAITETDS